MPKTIRSVAQWTCFSQVVLCALLVVGLTNVAEGQVGLLDHFRCYATQGQGANSWVILQDQFDVLGPGPGFELAFIASPFRFCNPVRKTDLTTGEVSEIVDRRNHLTMYTMAAFPASPPRDFLINNQFGEQRITTTRAVILGVPTDKNSEGRPENLDHFKCYLAQGDPVNRAVGLRDQFLDEPQILVGQPYLFCNPTVKLHGGVTLIENPEAHLTCYATTRTDYRDLITTENQFLATELQIAQADTLCVPSRKINQPGRADLVIRLPNQVQVSCPGGGGTCTEEVDWEVGEIAGVPVGMPFDVHIRNQLGQSATFTIPGIGANGTVNGTAVLGPPGDNCYNPNCTTSGEVDAPSPGVILEADEGNNTDTRTDQG